MDSADEQKSEVMSEESRRDLALTKEVSAKIDRELSRQHLEDEVSENGSGQPMSNTSGKNSKNGKGSEAGQPVSILVKQPSLTNSKTSKKDMKDRGNLVDPNAPLFQISPDERIANVFSEKATFSPNVFNASEIDLFAMENRARSKIHELMQPIQERIDQEQRQRAELQVTYDAVLVRLAKIEDLLGLSGGKPAIAVELETAMAELRAQSLQSIATNKLAITGLKTEQERVSGSIGEIRQIVATVEKALDRREATLADLQVENMKQKVDLANTFEQMQKRTTEISQDVVSECNRFDERLTGFVSRLKTLEVTQGQVQIQLTNLSSDTEMCVRKIQEFAMRKIDIDEFERQLNVKQEQWESTRLSCKDNFMQIVATDNYVDKYLPMRIQFQIGESLKSFLNHLPKPDSGNKRPNMKESFIVDEVVESEAMKRFMAYENDIYYKMHRLVMNDHGETHLAKRGVLKPGSLRVLTDEESKQLWKQVHERAQSEEDESASCHDGTSPLPKLDSEYQLPQQVNVRSRGHSAASSALRPQPATNAPSRNAEIVIANQSISIEQSSVGKVTRSALNVDMVAAGSVKSLTQAPTEPGGTQAPSEASPKRCLKRNYSTMIGESLERMRLDLRSETEKMREQLMSEVAQVRQETREALQQQLTFIEESYVDSKVTQQTNQRALRQQEAKVKSIDDFVQNLVLNKDGGYVAEPRMQRAETRNSAMSNKTSVQDMDESMNLSNKNSIEWLLDAARLQNILNQHAFENQNQLQMRISKLVDMIQMHASTSHVLTRQSATRASPEPRRRQVMTKQSDSHNGGRVTDPSMIGPSLDQMHRRESSGEVLSNLEQAHQNSTKLGFTNPDGATTGARGAMQGETPLGQASEMPSKAVAMPNVIRDTDTVSPPEHLSGSKMGGGLTKKAVKVEINQYQTDAQNNLVINQNNLLAVSDQVVSNTINQGASGGRTGVVGSSAETIDDLKLFQAGSSLTPTLHAPDGTLSRSSPTVRQPPQPPKRPYLVLPSKGDETKSDTVSPSAPPDSPLNPIARVTTQAQEMPNVTSGTGRIASDQSKIEGTDMLQLMNLIDRILVHCQRVQTVQKANPKTTRVSTAARRVSTAASQKRGSDNYPMSSGGPRGVKSIFSNRTIQQGSTVIQQRPSQTCLDNQMKESIGGGLVIHAPKTAVNRTILAAPRQKRLNSNMMTIQYQQKGNPQFYRFDGQSLLNTLTPTSQPELPNKMNGMSVMSAAAAPHGQLLHSERPKVRILRTKQGVHNVTADYLVDERAAESMGQQATASYLLSQTTIGPMAGDSLAPHFEHGRSSSGQVGALGLQGHLRRQLKSANVRKH